MFWVVFFKFHQQSYPESDGRKVNRILAYQKTWSWQGPQSVNANKPFCGVVLHIFNLTFRMQERCVWSRTWGGFESWESELPFHWQQSGCFFYTFYGINRKTDNQLRRRSVFKCVSIVYKGNVFNWLVVKHWRNCGISHNQTLRSFYLLK